MKVFVYFNLHKKLWSIKALEGPDKGRVIDRCRYVKLKEVQPKVSQKGRERVLREKRKNVHAGLVGTWIVQPIAWEYWDSLLPYRQVSYNPYKHEYFYFCNENDAQYTGSDYAELEVTSEKPFVWIKNRSKK
jgi:hypothetical protein